MLTTLRRAAAAALVAAPALAGAQTFSTLSQDNPARIPDLASLAAGGAVAALPTLDSPFISNPAHITQSGLFSFNVAGVTAGAGGNLRESYDFYDQELGPAIEEGIDEIRETDPARLEALYDEALRIGGQQKTAHLAVLAPSVRARTGPVAFGVAAYGNSVTRARMTDGGAGIPFVDLYGQADVIVPAVAGFDVSKTPAGLVMPFDLSVGVSAAFVQRRITAKSESVDALQPDGEKLYLLRGNTLRFGAGLYARNVMVPGVDLGAEVTSLGAAVDYDLEASWDVSGSEGAPDDMAEVEALQARFESRATDPVVRVGAAYRLPTLLVPGLSDTAVSVDYTTASTSEFDQSFQAGLRAGARATVLGVFGLQVGMSQGMPSAGVALKTKVARIEYATYGVEDGRLLGQLQRRNHVVQVRFGW
ncbi:MAG: hypothetical protein AAGJ11_11725, partial [Bacteroidota bacterium]